MTVFAQNEHPDWAVRETATAKASLGTHLALNSPDDALFVTRGTGALGDAQATLDVLPGTGVVRGDSHSIDIETPVDIQPGGGLPRRDVVYLADTGALAVEQGTPAPLRWSDDLAETERAISNAYSPAPPDMAAIDGLALAAVFVSANSNTLGTGTIEDLRARAPVGTAGGNAIDAAGDGKVVAVAPGLGVVDAIDPADTTTPVQDAIDLVESVGVSADGRYGAGAVLLPAGVTETPGDLHSTGGKGMLGFGRENTVLRVTDPTANCFAVGGPGSNSTKAYLDGFTITGGDRSARTAGSAINFNASPPDANTADMISVGFNIGQLQFENWGGPDPVIQGFGHSFSAQWDYLRATDYDGKFLVGRGFDNHIRQINVNHGTTDEPVVHLDNPNGPVHIGGINAGGASHRVLYLDGKRGWHAAVYIEDINVEPDRANEGALDPSVAPAPVEIYGVMPVVLGSVHQAHELTSRYTVAIGASPTYSGADDSGPGRNRIGKMWYDGGPTDALIGVLDAPYAPSWFWGARSDIDYNSHDQRALIPLEATATTDQLYGGPTLSELSNIAANRAANTWYQNTTGGPLQLTVWSQDTAGARAEQVVHVNTAENNRPVSANTREGDGTNNTYVTGTILVPGGSYYKVDAADIRKWFEAPLS